MNMGLIFKLFGTKPFLGLTLFSDIIKFLTESHNPPMSQYKHIKSDSMTMYTGVVASFDVLMIPKWLCS